MQNTPKIIPILAALGLSLSSIAAKAAPVQAVVELFTSQGCSSCPPADKLMSEIARKPEQLVLSFPVDYWDYIGWKDTFASPTFTGRQKAYAAGRGDGEVYTPQAVVDGLARVVGSDAEALAGAVQTVRGKSGAMSVSVELIERGGKMQANVAAGNGKGAVWLVKLAKSRQVAIGRGENAGRSIIYTNVVRQMVRLGDWNGAAASFELPVQELSKLDADGYAVLVQAGSMEKPAVILGAAKSDGV